MGTQRRSRSRHIRVLGLISLVLTACGAEPTPDAAPIDAPDLPAITVDLGSTRPDTAADTTLPDQPMTQQPAIWPAADVTFSSPEEAATDFVTSALISEGAPALGEFRPGDSRSGEMSVFFAGESGDLDPPLERGVLNMRQIGPHDGWYVIAAASDGAVIDTPSALEEIDAGVLTVSGEGRGFEGTMVVSAFRPGDHTADIDVQIGAGGPFADLEPYDVQLDLSEAAGGDIVVILVQGDTGLGNDPSTFAAIPIVIADSSIPPTG